jgi:hypothetical protein
MVFGSVSKHFANLRHLKKMENLCLSLSALFRGTKVANHPLYSVGTKVMFGSVSGHFANLRHLKRCKTCFWVECTISAYQSWEASILVHWTLNDVWKCLGAFCYPLACKRRKTCVRAWMHYFGVPKLWSIHSTPLDPKWCLGVLQSIALTLGT